ncbi:aspartate-semialdehyde dehydrogenase [Psychromonas sp. RZ22]|uniref:aspartate-semialdehyde dehydrogenase n=1 Tax=Psychromonas algarum TaxID=2555643 RepID=UPI0010681986|nr:aspartate-semialdehyde dehydrogenase [Psychromonas sp. RZ22]TEW55187.1 aspartate-semialdehyde dehydrogenase [Psychromonas sp. RZ22]
MNKEYNIALIGEIDGCIEATLEVLLKRDFAINNIFPLSIGECDTTSVMYSGKPVDVQEIESFDWQQVDIALFLADRDVAQQWVPVAKEHCVVIDISGYYLEDALVPLVQMGINDDDVARYSDANIIAIPSPETAQLTLAIKQIHQEVGIKRVTVAGYQSVSCIGKAGVTALAGETALLLNAKGIEHRKFKQQIAFNVVPQIDEFNEDGIDFSELRLAAETRRLLNDPEMVVSTTQVVVPMFYGCSQAVHVVTHYPVELEEVANALHHSDNIVLSESVNDYANMIDDVVGNVEVHVGRLRKDTCDAAGINMWVCADNVHYGIATNAVLVMEKLAYTYL